MTRTTWKYVAVLAMITLGGCAARNADENLDPKQLSRTGVVFASVSTAPEGGNGPVATFHLDRGGFVKSREEQIAGQNLKPSELNDDFGRLIVLELPAGANSLKSWMLTYGAAQYAPSRPVSVIHFTVLPGKALYLGNLHMHIRMSRNVFDAPVIGDLQPEIRDRGERDVVLFKSRYPRVGDGEIVAQPPFLGQWPHADSAPTP